jgi:hypothetical protein
MDATELWSLIATIEQQLPLQRDLLEALFGASFKGSVDHNKQPILVAATRQLEVELRPAKGTDAGALSIQLAHPSQVTDDTLVAQFTDGHWLPPPPPGYGPVDARGVYVANRSWGQIWFALHAGDRVARISFAPGARGSPGV